MKLKFKKVLKKLRKLKKFLKKCKNSKKSINKIEHFQKIYSQEKYTCRICFEKDLPKKMVYPCKCRGTLKWIHKKCLLNWITISKKMSCPQCNYTYKTKKINNSIFHNNNFVSNICLLIYAIIFILSGFMYRYLITYYFNINYKKIFHFNTLFIYNSIIFQTILIIIIAPIIYIYYPKIKNIIIESFREQEITSTSIVLTTLLYYKLLKKIIIDIINTYYPSRIEFINFQ